MGVKLCQNHRTKTKVSLLSGYPLGKNRWILYY